MSEIKNCPFCNGEAKIHITKMSQAQVAKIYCSGCSCEMSMLRPSKYKGDIGAELIGAWNTRKPMQEIVEKLEELDQPCYECRDSCNEKCLIERAIEIVKEVGGMNDM